MDRALDLYRRQIAGNRSGIRLDWDARPRAAKLRRKSDVSGTRLEARVWLDHLALNYPADAQFILGLDKYRWWRRPCTP